MAGPCNCPDPEVLGCQCSGESTDSIAVTGAATPANPWHWDIVLDPDPDNIATISASGLLVDPVALKALVNLNDLNAAIRLNALENPPSIRKTRVAQTTFNDGDTLTYDTVEYDSDTMDFSATTILINTPGKYRFGVYIEVDNSNANRVAVQLRLNGNVVSAHRNHPDPADAFEAFVSHSDEFACVAGDAITTNIGEGATGAVTVVSAKFYASRFSD